ncbi:hypothetical protein EK21DRAFT_112118 [Setomelanomma holmii]|uniref:DUF7053 domain-containing protein n=1 Tax=Setomelanomma holmii TaxID=210430 RepID=A0A9P4LLU1_9PLEO|nr:hypothetical protein EK21DRAFT_112118 [Setomelanomma holmii]
MSAKHNLHTAASIPAHIPPETILAALHNHENALTLQALTQGHKKLPSTDRATLKDTYWYPTDRHPVETYEVTEVIKFLPGVGELGKKYIKFPSCFQDTPTGIRTRADASGVIVRAEFRVVQGGAAAEVEGENGGVGDAEWVLVEDVEVTCAWWMMPFVRGKMEQAHRGICSKVVEKVEMEMRQQAVANGDFGGRHSVQSSVDSNRGKGRLDTDKALPRVPPQQGAFEVDAMETQRMEMPADVPEKITYR